MLLQDHFNYFQLRYTAHLLVLQEVPVQFPPFPVFLWQFGQVKINGGWWPDQLGRTGEKPTQNNVILFSPVVFRLSMLDAKYRVLIKRQRYAGLSCRLQHLAASLWTKTVFKLQQFNKTSFQESLESINHSRGVYSTVPTFWKLFLLLPASHYS